MYEIIIEFSKLLGILYISGVVIFTLFDIIWALSPLGKKEMSMLSSQGAILYFCIDQIIGVIAWPYSMYNMIYADKTIEKTKENNNEE